MMSQIPNPQNTPSNINITKLNQRYPPNPQVGHNYNNNAIYSNLNNANNLNNNIYNQNRINIINNNIDYSNQNQIISQRPNINNSNNNIINTNNSLNLNTNMIINNNINTNKCTCSKTGCRKKYCACFSRGKLCDGCECKNCQNCIQYQNNQSPIIQKQNNENDSDNKEFGNNEDIISPNNKRVICNCTKSNCMKKYCECFKQGFRCNSLCRCLDCKNKIYINNMNDFTDNNNMNINNNMNANYNMNSALKNYDKKSIGYNNNNYISNDSINTNNFYNYALHNNINNNIINNNIINTVPEARNIPSSYIPETFGGKFIDYSNPLNFQSEAFAIFIKKEKLKIEKRKLDLLSNNKEINKDIKINDIVNKEILNNSFDEINETPKYTGKKKLRDKTSNLNSIKTCPTTNSSNKLRKAVPAVNKNIKKKKLQLN